MHAAHRRATAGGVVVVALIASTAGLGCQDAAPVMPAATGADTSCPESPAPRHPNGTLLEIPVALRFRGNVMRFAEANTTAGGGTVTPLNVRFYLSDVSLIKTGAAATVPVDIVGAGGRPLPYGVHLYSGDDPATQVLRVRAPAGQYDGIAFSFGLGDACNAGPLDRNPPLSSASQMTWPHAFGYLLFRYEARVTDSAPDGAGGGDGGAGDAGGAPGLPAAIHMGGWPHLVLAPPVRAAGPLAIPPAPAAPAAPRTLFLVMDEVFRGASLPATSELPLTPPGPEAAFGENLRQAAKALTLFVLVP